ncbi:hypothetical protein DL89DRAFT_136126 [Linderina pennispora]|uniref:Secreted protein n=1 Tax=Linderina pennispora TaxID=61395 RepID=A0A1Y1WBE5_9FUNG|nr:uncharacterized protein DL89DRAFT_136126 [Linderina pennispora]ORX70566.1 hypothetical protein DL89DRAFT_136126 [Linderina pennispora]
MAFAIVNVVLFRTSNALCLTQQLSIAATNTQGCGRFWSRHTVLVILNQAHSITAAELILEATDWPVSGVQALLFLTTVPYIFIDSVWNTYLGRTLAEGTPAIHLVHAKTLLLEQQDHFLRAGDPTRTAWSLVVLKRQPKIQQSYPVQFQAAAAAF